MLSNRGFVLGFALYGAVAMLSSCNYRSEEFRYRMTVEVETPQGPRTGSSVIEVQVSDPGPNSFPEAGINTKVRGEAVSVDLPDGKVLFALLRSRESVDAASGYAYKALRPAQHRGDYAFIERTKELKRMRGTGLLPRDAYPMLVTFGDLNDPTSVVRVDPDNLAGVFGEGVALRRITVEITGDPVTTGIENQLKWFRDLARSGGGLIPMIKNERGRYEVAPGYDETLAELGLSNFSTEAYK